MSASTRVREFSVVYRASGEDFSLWVERNHRSEYSIWAQQGEDENTRTMYWPKEAREFRLLLAGCLDAVDHAEHNDWLMDKTMDKEER